MTQNISPMYGQQQRQSFGTRKKNNTNPIFLQSFLGGVSSIIAGTSVYPLDTAKTRVQLQVSIVGVENKYKNSFQGMFIIAREEGKGFKGLLKGAEASAIRSLLYSGARLGMYEPIKDMMKKEGSQEISIPRKVAAGALSGLLASCISNPLELLKVKMQAQPQGEYRPLPSHILDIYRNGGLSGIYRGYQISILRLTLQNALCIGCYDAIKTYFVDQKIMKDGIQCQFVSSFISGFILAVIGSPVDVLKTQVMSCRSSYGKEGRQSCGIIDVSKDIYNAGGFRQFYKGFGAQWLGFAPFTIIQLIIWEQLRIQAGIGNL